MQDKLSAIQKIIAEHQSIKGHIKLTGDTVADQEALKALEQLRIDWVPGRLDILTERRNKLEQAINLLHEGISKHFAFEERIYPELLGPVFTEALVMDHDEIKNEIKETQSLIARKGMEGLSREDLLDRESDIQQSIDGLCHLIEDHAGREEVVLEMVNRVLKEHSEDS